MFIPIRPPSIRGPLHRTALAVLMGMASPLAQADTGTEETVLAVVNGTAITADQRPGEAGPELAQDYASMSTAQQAQLLVSLINRQLVLEQARATGFDQRPAIQQRLQAMADSYIAEQYLLSVASGFDLGNDAVQARYAERYAEAPEEFLVRHIVLASETEGRAVLRAIGSGADFGDLARERSLDTTSAIKGGDLGWVTQDQLPPSLAEVLNTLKEGAVATNPVKTLSGWHVLLLEDRRDGTAPALEAVENQIRQELATEQMAAYLQNLREQATIELR